jgi:DNA-binding NarL/FixJ family response regulator
MTVPIRILLVEDDPQWQAGIRALLMTDTRFELSEIADHFEEAMTAFQTVRPSAVLLDWKIKGDKDGLAVGEAMLDAGMPPERIILISGSPAGSIPSHPFLYVPKHRLVEDLIPLLRSVTIT